MMNTKISRSLFFCMFILLFTFIFPYTCNAFNTLVFNESVPGLVAIAQLRSAQSYPDNTIVLRFIKPINISCNEPEVFLRIVYPNATVTKLDIPLPPESISTCVGYGLDFVQVDVIPPHYLLLSYITKTFVNGDPTQARFQRVGYTVDVNGQASNNSSDSRISLTEAVSVPSNANIVPGINEDDGFLLTYQMTSDNVIGWSKWGAIQQNQTFTELASGNLPSVHNAYPFATTNGGYGIAYTVLSSTDASWQAFVQLMDSTANGFGQPYIIHETNLALSDFTVHLCDFAYGGAGYNCILKLEQRDATSGVTRVTFMLANFLTSGSVVQLENLNFDGVALPFDDITPLFYGGFFVTFYNKLGTDNQSVVGYAYGNDGSNASQWDIPDTVRVSDTYTVLSNNTLVALSETLSNSWKLVATDLHKFINDKGYDNFNIGTTEPMINASFPIPPASINITFTQPVLLSFGNISIYQYDSTGAEMLRQTVSGMSSYVQVRNDGYAVSVTVLESTFNQPGAFYYATTDNNFVRSNQLGEPMFGIAKKKWIFSRQLTNDNVHDEGTFALLRLNQNGTAYFSNLDNDGMNGFFDSLLSELVAVLPLSPGRLTTSKKHQFDTANSAKVLLQVHVEAGNTSEPSTGQVVTDLDTMVKNKAITPLVTQPLASMLDETFGFEPIPDLWHKYRMRLLYLIGFFMFFLLAFIIAHRLSPESRNWAIFPITFICIDYALDIAFIARHGNDVPSLYYPSIIILFLSFAYNVIMAFLILLREKINNVEFDSWFKDNLVITSLLTILSGAELEALRFISSRFAGLHMFAAPLSKAAESWILWAGFSTLVIEDIPQFVIQVIYLCCAISYDIIPFSTLVMSIIVLCNNLFTRLYYIVCGCLRDKAYRQPSIEGQLTSSIVSFQESL